MRPKKREDPKNSQEEEWGAGGRAEGEKNAESRDVLQKKDREKCAQPPNEGYG